MKLKIKHDLAKPGKNFAIKQISLSLTVVCLTCLVALILGDKKTSFSMFIGGLIAVFPYSVFAFKAFKHSGATASKKVVESFYSGVKIKMVLTAILFALAFKFLVIAPIPFFVMYTVIMVLPLLRPLLLK